MTDEAPKKIISQDTKIKALQSALYHFSVSQPFVGSMLQELNMKYDESVPTAGIGFNKKQETFGVVFNPEFFCSLSLEERVAVLHHEILHFTNKHLFRLPFMDVSPEERSLYNLAGDMAINQYIKNLPSGCVDVKDWKLKSGSAFPTYQSMETYYELIKNNKESNKDKLSTQKTLDEHDWEKLDEATKEQMLDAAKKLIKRTIEKTAYSHTNIPESLKDLLTEIEVEQAALDYKRILRETIKKTVCMTDRDNTWKRPNKRYGCVSPGSTLGALPSLVFYNDSSGSISQKEQNEYLRIMDGFLSVGSRKCTIAFWHTSLYYRKPYRRGQTLDESCLQSGGTDVQCVLEDIRKTKPDLSFILTDGYFDACDVEVTSQVIFIISKGGNKHHPMAHIGKTIMLESLS